MLATIAALVDACPEIVAIELNPVRVYEQGALVLDARIRAAPPHRRAVSQRVDYQWNDGRNVSLGSRGLPCIAWLTAMPDTRFKAAQLAAPLLDWEPNQVSRRGGSRGL